MGALGDRFFFLGLSSLAMALAAVVVWNGISLDERDALILGPLPISRALVIRAKIKAVAIFASLFALALNAISSIGYPVAVSNTLPVGFGGLATLVAAQFVTTMAAAFFGFVAVIALRESIRLLLGRGLFARMSAALQAGFVMVLGALLLLLPGSTSRVSGWLSASSGHPYANPALWFLGLHERLAGHVFVGLPHRPYPDAVAALETSATTTYASFESLFRGLSMSAVLALGIALVLAGVTYTWNSRRLPLGASPNQRRQRDPLAGWVDILACLFVRTPEGRAGFFFALKALWRSAPQRLSLAASSGTGFAAAMVLLQGVPFSPPADITSVPLRALSVQLVLIGIVVLGFRQAVRVPAELRANWTFHLCWPGDGYTYLSGVKLAGLFSLAVPLVTGMFFLAVPMLGWHAAIGHMVFGLALSMLLVELSLFRLGKWPFASTYASEDNLKALASIYAVLFILVTATIAWIEREALASVAGTSWLVGTTLALFILVRWIDSRPHPSRTAVAWSETLVEGAHVDLSGVEW